MPELPAEEMMLASVEQVLETMFFTSAVEGEPPECCDEPAIRTRVPFRGEPSGVFALSISDCAARVMAADFLGLEEGESLTAEQVADVVCELSNMICGNLLSRLEAGSTFEILSPELGGAGAGTGAGRQVTRSVNLGNGALTVSLAFEAEGDEAR